MNLKMLKAALVRRVRLDQANCRLIAAEQAGAETYFSLDDPTVPFGRRTWVVKSAPQRPAWLQFACAVLLRSWQWADRVIGQWL